MTQPPTTHTGTLRPEVFVKEGGGVVIQWKDETREVVWTEECQPKDGLGFASKIVCTGDFKVDPLLYFVDSSGHRHFVLDAEPGELGATMGD